MACSLSSLYREHSRKDHSTVTKGEELSHNSPKLEVTTWGETQSALDVKGIWPQPICHEREVPVLGRAWHLSSVLEGTRGAEDSCESNIPELSRGLAHRLQSGSQGLLAQGTFGNQLSHAAYYTRASLCNCTLSHWGDGRQNDGNAFRAWDLSSSLSWLTDAWTWI